MTITLPDEQEIRNIVDIFVKYHLIVYYTFIKSRSKLSPELALRKYSSSFDDQAPPTFRQDCLPELFPSLYQLLFA